MTLMLIAASSHGASKFSIFDTGDILRGAVGSMPMEWQVHQFTRTLPPRAEDGAPIQWWVATVNPRRGPDAPALLEKFAAVMGAPQATVLLNDLHTWIAACAARPGRAAARETWVALAAMGYHLPAERVATWRELAEAIARRLNATTGHPWRANPADEPGIYGVSRIAQEERGEGSRPDLRASPAQGERP